MAHNPKALSPSGNLISQDYPDTDNPLVWQSMTGVDMVASFRFDEEYYSDKESKRPHSRVFAELQTISVSGTRSVSPVRCLGESSVRAYTRGARTIAGSLIFAMFSEDPLNSVARLDPAQETYNASEPFFIDQIPEFDIIVNSINEYGSQSQALIGGVTLTNYGTTLSIHDIYTEISYTYVARFFIPMTIDKKGFDRVRELLHEPIGRKASDQAKTSMISGWVSTDDLATKMIENLKSDTVAGRFARRYNS